MTYGYVRVSTVDQNEARQVEAMRSCDCDIQSLTVEKQSGKNFDRPKWKELVSKLQHGDLLVVKSIDRLGRNYDEIIEWWRRITKEIGADIVVLDMPLLDTRGGKDLTGKLIADIVLQLLSYVAQTERESIRERQREGIAAAKARGVYKGRQPVKIDMDKLRAEHDAIERGETTAKAAMQRLGLASSTFYRRMRELEAAN